MYFILTIRDDFFIVYLIEHIGRKYFRRANIFQRKWNTFTLYFKSIFANKLYTQKRYFTVVCQTITTGTKISTKKIIWPSKRPHVNSAQNPKEKIDFVKRQCFTKIAWYVDNPKISRNKTATIRFYWFEASQKQTELAQNIQRYISGKGKFSILSIYCRTKSRFVNTFRTIRFSGQKPFCENLTGRLRM